MKIDRRTLITALPVILTGAGLPDAAARIKPSIVGIAVMHRGAGGPPRLSGSGFVIGDGRHVITNLHVAQQSLKDRPQPSAVASVGVIFVLVPGVRPQRRLARLVARDSVYDLAVLQIDGDPLPTASIEPDPAFVPDGTDVAVTGFPIGSILGLTPATHKGVVAATTRNITPSSSAARLDVLAIRGARFKIYQLDLIAYPGNSGSPLYRVDNGQVVGLVSSGLVKKNKERDLLMPTGISFAVPSRYLIEFLEKNKISF